ncbi:MAG: hypothetical protein AB7F09_27370 [Parvibaculaceae bacterium]
MQSGSSFLFGVLAAAFLASGAIEVNAQAEIPLLFGTYARDKDWCKVSRADQNGPDYKEKRAFINLSETEINWNQTAGRITTVSVEGSKINLGLELATNGKVETKTYLLIRKSKKIFVLTGINFFHCTDYQPNPWLGR